MKHEVGMRCVGQPITLSCLTIMEMVVVALSDYVFVRVHVLYFYFFLVYLSAFLIADSKEIIDEIKSKDVLDKISAIFRTVTSNLDIK